ncbi:MAG TPA: NAD(P)-dependent oxidoreductase [Candidatus Baltobacteraceae bacterium]|nr:NAD(P)-dependent oxidoreductase [Candidatus Baltobacteraceae bacterium]
MPLRETAPKLSPEQYEKNFAEIAPALNPRQAAIESSRCLYCFDAPCTMACPTHIDVPTFIKKISTGNLQGSARTILSANILGHSCGRVCPTEVLCEGACVMHEKGEPPIEIGRLQRYAVDHVLDNGVELFQAGASNGKKVACIGSGPASLACAAELAKWGYDVTIFDRNEHPGGLNTYGIAAYKARAKDSIREVELVRKLGVKFRQKVEVGRDILFAEIEKQFDAVFIGVGLGETWGLSLPGEDLHGVYGAIEFVAKTKAHPLHEVEVGARVACIGAGNTAIDVVTAARRLGADTVYLIYRRGEPEMPAFAYEYQLAKQDAVVFLWQTQPVRVIGSNGAVIGIECMRTRLGPPDDRGRRIPEPIPGTEFTLDVEMVVRAVGQQPVTEQLRAIQGLELHKNGTVKVDERHQTENPKFFAGGDCVNGGKEVVDAVAEGMSAAGGIDAWLRARRAGRRSDDRS